MSDDLLKKVDPSRRGFLRSLVGAAAFATPLLLSFRMDGIGSLAGAGTLTGSTSTSNQTTEFFQLRRDYLQDSIKRPVIYNQVQLETKNLYFRPTKDGSLSPMVRGPITSNMTGYVKLDPGEVFVVEKDGARPQPLSSDNIIVYNQLSSSCPYLGKPSGSWSSQGVYVSVRQKDGKLTLVPVHVGTCHL